MKSNLRRRKFINNLFKAIVIVLSILLAAPLFLILFYLFKEGITSISWDFIVNLPKPVGETGGGISNAILGTFELILIASIIAIPVGIAVGIFITEFKKNKLTYFVKLSVDILQGTPSVVIGMIVYIWVVRTMGTFSALSGGIALCIMMLPVIIASTEETLKLLPSSLKESSFALGAPYYSTILRVVLPSAISGILTGVLLSVARVAGETAPLLFTAFGSQFFNLDITRAISSLPHVIFTYATSPYTEFHSLAWGASFILIIFVLLMNISAKLISRRWKVNF